VVEVSVNVHPSTQKWWIGVYFGVRVKGECCFPLGKQQLQQGQQMQSNTYFSHAIQQFEFISLSRDRYGEVDVIIWSNGRWEGLLWVRWATHLTWRYPYDGGRSSYQSLVSRERFGFLSSSRKASISEQTQRRGISPILKGQIDTIDNETGMTWDLRWIPSNWTTVVPGIQRIALSNLAILK